MEERPDWDVFSSPESGHTRRLQQMKWERSVLLKKKKNNEKGGAT